MEMDMQGSSDMRRKPVGSPRVFLVRAAEEQKCSGPGRADSIRAL